MYKNVDTYDLDDVLYAHFDLGPVDDPNLCISSTYSCDHLRGSVPLYTVTFYPWTVLSFNSKEGKT